MNEKKTASLPLFHSQQRLPSFYIQTLPPSPPVYVIVQKKLQRHGVGQFNKSQTNRKGFLLPIFLLDVKLHRATGDADEEEQRQLVGTSITKVGAT